LGYLILSNNLNEQPKVAQQAKIAQTGHPVSMVSGSPLSKLGHPQSASVLSGPTFVKSYSRCKQKKKYSWQASLEKI